MERVNKPWGFYKVIEKKEKYLIKKLVVFPRKRLSLQSHKHRCEHWIAVKGVAKVIIEDKEFTLEEREHTFINVGEKHRLENPREEILEIIEIWIGDILSEDDIKRFSDDFGRS
jgi:mannose-1-phosphate guanylyltransferase/mannose-6-phosphate isomerase